ncbi:hypothetical protein AMK59_8053, partial [Oryctes borbonicus]
KNLSTRFSRKNDDYNQFFKMYNVRLDRMSKYLLDAIKKKWGDKYPICKLYKLAEEDEDICVVIGTLFKDQKLKPSVLKQLAESNQLMPQPITNRFTDESDVLYLEDELQRFQLEGILNKELLVTGITCALLGRNKGDGKFEVIDYTFADYRPQIERPLMNSNVYVVLLSGLDLSHLEKSSLSIRLLVNWLSGYLGDINEVCTADITRVVIAGNSVKTSSDDEQMKFTMIVHSSQKSDVVDAIKILDAFLLELCQVIDVDLMPGRNDPSNYVLPQKGLHHCLFPQSKLYKSFNRVTNPYECEINGIRLLGSSGEPISDILKFSEYAEPIDVLENCLKWNHIAPTAPDTLACFPFYDNDPFIIEDCPHVFFAGNQKKFATKLAKGAEGQVTRLICIPEFSSTFTAA